MRRVILFMILGFLSPQLALSQSGEEILKKADAVRNPADSYMMIVDVENKDGDTSRFEVKVKGGRKTLIKTLAPARDRGRNMLMIGEDMWSYVPNLKRSVRIALNQKLSGEAANGDISRMRWAGDYDVVIEQETATAWTLFLTANKKGLTYDKIRLWVAKKTFQPIKAEYLSLDKQVLKFARFEDYRIMEGKQRPGTLIISDAKRQNLTTRLIIREAKKSDFADALFQESSLGE